MSNEGPTATLHNIATESFTQTSIPGSVHSITEEIHTRLFEKIGEVELKNHENRRNVQKKKVIALMKPKLESEGTSKRSSFCDLCRDPDNDICRFIADSSSEDLTDDISINDCDLGNQQTSALCYALKKGLIGKKPVKQSDSKSSSDLICRICHGGDSTDDLITPCRCRGTVAVVHLACLERWLRESSHSYCELCQHHYKIIRQPKYSIPRSILVFLRHPGEHLKEILLDLLAFTLYTPSAVASTYMLMMICESLMKNNIITSGSLSSHIIAFSAVFGMAAIDFSYSSWLLMIIHKHYLAWKDWYRNSSEIRVIFSNMKMRTLRRKAAKHHKSV